MRGIDHQRRHVQRLRVCVASRLYRRGGRIRFAKKQSRSIPLPYPTAIRLGFSIGRVYKSPWSATNYRSSRTAVENRIVSILGSEPTVRPKYRMQPRVPGVWSTRKSRSRQGDRYRQVGLYELIFVLGIDPNSGFQDRCTGETAVSTKRGFESSTSRCSAGDIRCRILHLKPCGLMI